MKNTPVFTTSRPHHRRATHGVHGWRVVHNTSCNWVTGRWRAKCPVLYQPGDDRCQQLNHFTMQAQFVACRARSPDAWLALQRDTQWSAWSLSGHWSARASIPLRPLQQLTPSLHPSPYRSPFLPFLDGLFLKSSLGVCVGSAVSSFSGLWHYRRFWNILRLKKTH